MLTIGKNEVLGWEHAIRGMRNPLNSWAKSDSYWDDAPTYPVFKVGKNDKKLMETLSRAGATHGKFKRMLHVYVDITAPLYWWKEFDTYKVGTVCNSCSTMHKIHEKEFTLEDFSTEHLNHHSKVIMTSVVYALNTARDMFIETKEKDDWWQMIQLLPSSYNQKRTIDLNYEVLTNIYHTRKNHKLDEWKTFNEWIETLPCSGLITGLDISEAEEIV